MPPRRGPLIRHVALCAATVLALAAREHLGVGHSVLWMLGLAATLNLATALCLRRPVLGRLAQPLSPAFGLAGWAALMLLTGGAASPFFAGLLLEEILAGYTGSVTSVALTSAGATAALWSSHLFAADSQGWIRPALQTGFLLVTGTVTGYVTSRWQRSREQLSRRHDEIQRRLERIEKDLDDARAMGRIGENAARLAHGFKNTVHSLRGYASLIEPRLARSGTERDLLDGLTTAIDGLEDLASATIGAPGLRPPGAGGVGLENGGAIVSDVVRDIGASFPEVRWSLSLTDVPSLVRPSLSVLREVLTTVVRNAAEAIQGQGEVAVEAARRNGTLEINVRDYGPGLSPSVGGNGFKRGCTTKPGGNGLGLFLARRLLEARGGFLTLSSEAGGGTLCRIEFPLIGRVHEHDEPLPADR